MKKTDTIPAARMRMQDSHKPDIPDTPPLGAAVLLPVAVFDAVLVAALAVLAVTDFVADTVVVPEFVTDVEAVEDTVWVTDPEEELSTRMLAPEGTAEVATSTDVDTPETTDATRTEPLETAADALEEAADKTEVTWATFDEITEAKLDRALVGLGVGIGATVAVAASDARELADSTILLTPVKAEETIAEFAANRLKLVEAIISKVGGW